MEHKIIKKFELPCLRTSQMSSQGHTGKYTLANSVIPKIKINHIIDVLEIGKYTYSISIMPGKSGFKILSQGLVKEVFEGRLVWANTNAELNVIWGVDGGR